MFTGVLSPWHYGTHGLHRDVYKRQLEPKVTAVNIRLDNNRRALENISEKAAELTAVSYTHLDVYKRQP